MKRIVFVFSVVGLAVLLFSSCNKTYTLGPLPPPVYTPTFTPTPTPACGFWNPNITSTPTPTGVWTPVPTVCFNCQAPVTTFSYTPFTGKVIRSLADWQALYGAGAQPPAGVNFATDMILIGTFPGCCSGSGGFINVCETATDVEVSVYDRPWRAPFRCWAICFTFETIVVPQSNLPVVITETVTY